MTTQPIVFSIVGASMRSAMLFEFLKRNPEQGRIAGIFDTIPARGAHIMSEYGCADGILYPSLEAAVEDPSVDAVFVGTPDHAHVEVTCQALAAGKHVYCEKPLAITLEHCDAMIDAADRSSATFYLGKNLRHAPVYEYVNGLVADGSLGKVLTIEANEHYHEGRTYFRRWNRLRRCGGGLWITKACHDFDLLNWMAAAAPVRVFASASLEHYKSRPEAGTHCRVCPIKDDCQDYYNVDAPAAPLFDALARLSEEQTGQPRDICLFNSDKDTFDNGIAVVEYANHVRATYTVNVLSARTTRQMVIVGTRGSVESDLATGIVTYTPRFWGEAVVKDLSGAMNSGHGGADDRILTDFLNCCRTGAKPRTGAVDGRLSVALGLAARESVDSGLPIEL